MDFGANLGPSWSQIGAKLGPSWCHVGPKNEEEEEEEEEEEKEEEQEKKWNFGGHKSKNTHLRVAAVMRGGVVGIKDLQGLAGICMWFNHGRPLRGRRIQLRRALSPPPCLDWLIGSSVDRLID